MTFKEFVVRAGEVSERTQYDRIIEAVVREEDTDLVTIIDSDGGGALHGGESLVIADVVFDDGEVRVCVSRDAVQRTIEVIPRSVSSVRDLIKWSFESYDGPEVKESAGSYTRLMRQFLAYARATDEVRCQQGPCSSDPL